MSNAEDVLDAVVTSLTRAARNAEEAANRSVLDGTVSCQICRALVLESNAAGHYRWHYGGQKVDFEQARRFMG